MFYGAKLQCVFNTNMYCLDKGNAYLTPSVKNPHFYSSQRIIIQYHYLYRTFYVVLVLGVLVDIVTDWDRAVGTVNWDLYCNQVPESAQVYFNSHGQANLRQRRIRNLPCF